MPAQNNNIPGHRNTIQPPAFDETVRPLDTVPTTQTGTVLEEEPAANVFDIPFYDIWINFFTLGLIITFVFLVAAVYSIIRMRQVRHAEKAKMDAEPPGLAMSMFLEGDEHGKARARGSDTEMRWEQIAAHARSDNPNDWRLAIIEADIMLDALTTERGYSGESLGEKLKQVNRASWQTIDLAWEAHKARNRIAHEGAAHELTEREVRRIMGLYEQVFREFNYI